MQQIDGRGNFAFAGATFGLSNENWVDFHKLEESDFKDERFIGYKLGSESSLCQSLQKGILLGLNELSIEQTKVTITDFAYLLVDASDEGFCFTGHQLVYKHFEKPICETNKITRDLLKQTLKKANDLANKTT